MMSQPGSAAVSGLRRMVSVRRKAFLARFWRGRVDDVEIADEMLRAHNVAE